MRELESLEDLEEHLDAARPLAGVALQGLDLRGRWGRLRERDVAGSLLLGCSLDPADLVDATARGALVFPELPGLPYRCFRSRLYTVAELYAGFDPARPESYADTLDARVYAHWQATGGATPPDMVEALARRLHDHGISDALEELLPGDGGSPRPVVAIMGGHSMERGTAAYAQVAELGRRLTRQGFLVATGGGPGAMEAGHLGAYLAAAEDPALEAAQGLLARAPTYRHPEWLAQAFRVRQRWPLGDEVARRHPSLGIPTWLYGHEPPNAFASHVAKYFTNAVREEGLLSIALGGVIFAPGSAGTIQEIFQDACQNHYRAVGVVSPMVFLGVDYWTRVKPVYPLLQQLALGHEYGDWLAITDSLDEATAQLVRYRREGPVEAG